MLIPIKNSIENKISIPFLTLFIVSLMIVLITSFRFDYNYVLDSQFRNMDKKLKEIEISLHLRLHEDNDTTKLDILDNLRLIYPQNLLIYENGELILGNDNLLTSSEIDRIKAPMMDYNHINGDAYLIDYKYVETMKWIVVLKEDKRELMSFFYESYKYNILIAIIFLTLAMQITILVSANITRPIKNLVKFCDQISSGNHHKRIRMKRSDELGKLAGALNQMLDKLNSSMKELIDVKNYNQDILNNIEQGIITFSVDSQISSTNPFAMEIILQFSDYSYNGDAIEKVLNQLIDLTINSSKSQYNLYKFKGDDGDFKFLEVNTSIIKSGEEATGGYICSFKDITQQKQVESQVQRLERLASTGRLAAGVAHEIRNPLAGMRASIQVLSKRFKNQLSGKNEEMFLRLIQEIDRINKLIYDLLEYSKRHTTQPKAINLLNKISEILALIENELDAKNIELILEAEESDAMILVDSVQFSQIILNILKNSIEAIEENHGRIKIKIFKMATNVVIVVNDNGSGIPQEALDNIFDPFFTTKNEGTGLGLSIVHELVMENEGKIDVQSVSGEGTSVTLTFKSGD